MSLVLLVLKAATVWETPYDWALLLVVVDLDLLVLADWRRLWLYKRASRE